MCIQLNGKIQQLRSPYNSFRKTGPTTQQLGPTHAPPPSTQPAI
jgi:hypothetical protein